MEETEEDDIRHLEDVVVNAWYICDYEDSEEDRPSSEEDADEL